MRIVCALGVLCLMLAMDRAWAQPAACGPQAIGVSRTVEIDTTTGPRFGFQYHNTGFLNDGEVVLTFDDGPLRSHTRPILETLAAHCTKATFFVVGRMAVSDPEMVREYARQGHTVGTHTWSHANLGALSPERGRAEIELGFSAVRRAMGAPIAPFFRFPYLRDTRWTSEYLANRHVAMFSIDVDSKDYRTRDPSAVHRKVMADLARARKGIILFHDIHGSTARALPGLLADLKANGYKVVHMRPKLEAATVADFDSQADQELGRRKAVLANDPLAKRALTWPVAKDMPAQSASIDVQETRPQRPRPVPRTEVHENWWPWR